MTDLTVIMLTANLVPKKWAKYHKKVLLKAIGKAKLITLSQKPLDFGHNVLQKRPVNQSNIWYQMYRGATRTDTEYIAIAEDDTLYHPNHFLFRPKREGFYYNLCHWTLFTWGKPLFHWRNVSGNYAFMGTRRLVVETLRQIFKKYPDGIPPGLACELGRDKLARHAGIEMMPMVNFYTNPPIVNFAHRYGLDHLAKKRKKKMGYLRCPEVPYWGRAEDLVKKFR